MHNTHPSMTPGAIIGYRRNGTPIRLIAGGAPEDDAGNGAGDGQGATGGDGGQGSNPNDDSGAGTGGQGAPAGQSSGTAGAPQADDAAARTIAAIRDDFKSERAKRQAAEKRLADLEAARAKDAEDVKQRNMALAKALGLPGSEDPPDPEKLAAELAAERQARQQAVDQSTARERELSVELQLLRQAARHGANPELLGDSRSFMSAIAKLDPTSDDFATELGDAIKAAVEKNPSFKLNGVTPPAGSAGNSSGTSNAAGSGTAGDGSGDGQGTKTRPQKQGTTAPPARSGSDGGHNGTAGGNRQWTIADVDAASPSQVTQAIADGLLVDLGYAPPKSRR